MLITKLHDRESQITLGARKKHTTFLQKKKKYFAFSLVAGKRCLCQPFMRVQKVWEFFHGFFCIIDRKIGAETKRNKRREKRTVTSYGSKNRQWISLDSLSTKTVRISKPEFFKNQKHIAVLFHSWLQISLFFQTAGRCCGCRRTPVSICFSQNVAPSAACVLSRLLFLPS